jgi:hypothetical protein
VAIVVNDDGVADLLGAHHEARWTEGPQADHRTNLAFRADVRDRQAPAGSCRGAT